MLVVIKQGMSKARIRALMKKLRPRKRKNDLPDLRKFAGSITLKEDPMVIQKRMRDEWG